ncbi:hypothetical protein VTL71DRAFT_5126 [Oculimacula yallundae]|uniref:Uncharacterized protein n=1 Tax=Oculimacula yallundae TaxID=86028 RepID=A0ABR4C1E0_9HELO
MRNHNSNLEPLLAAHHCQYHAILFTIHLINHFHHQDPRTADNQLEVRAVRAYRKTAALLSKVKSRLLANMAKGGSSNYHHCTKPNGDKCNNKKDTTPGGKPYCKEHQIVCTSKELHNGKEQTHRKTEECRGCKAGRARLAATTE